MLIYEYECADARHRDQILCVFNYNISLAWTDLVSPNRQRPRTAMADDDDDDDDNDYDPITWLKRICYADLLFVVWCWKTMLLSMAHCNVCVLLFGRVHTFCFRC